MIQLENNNNYILDILSLINSLQKKSSCIETNNSCAKPILGDNNIVLYNTRPISFYLCNNEPLTVSYSDGETSIFRVENIDGNCVTVRILVTGEDNTITATNEFATINIGCIAAIKCLNDINLTL